MPRIKFARVAELADLFRVKYAAVVELADTHDSKSCAERHVGSTPTGGTKILGVPCLPAGRDSPPGHQAKKFCLGVSIQPRSNLF